MAGGAGSPSFPTAALGRPASQLGAFGADAVLVVVLVLSMLLLLVSLLHRMLEEKRSGRSALTLLPHQIEDADGSAAKAHDGASRHRNKNCSSTKPLSCSFPPHPSPPAAQLGNDDDVGKVDVEATAGLARSALGTPCDGGSNAMVVCGDAQLACGDVPAASGPEAAQPSGIEQGIVEEVAEDGQDVHASQLAVADAPGKTFSQSGLATNPGVVQGPDAQGASCSCKDKMWGCECHMVYGKGLLLAHLAINRRVALGAPGLQRRHQASSHAVLPSAVLVPGVPSPQARIAKSRGNDARESWSRASMAPRCARTERCR